MKNGRVGGLHTDTTGFIRVYLYVIWGGKGAILLLMIKKKSVGNVKKTMTLV